MTVKVTDSNGRIINYSAATNYTTDEGQLLVFNGTAAVAVYAPGFWSSAARGEF